MKKYALLFSGMSNLRHVDDLEFLYRTLINVSGYDATNITVLNLDGTLSYRDSNNNNKITSLKKSNWPGNNTPYTLVVNDSGNFDSLKSNLKRIGQKLSSDDQLFIHVNNHGGNSSNPDQATSSFICTYGGGGGNDWTGKGYTEDQMTSSLNGMNSFKNLIVMMEQCYSGGFKNVICNDAKAQNVSFAAAATYNRESTGQPNWDAFAKDWIMAASRTNPDDSPLSKPPASNNLQDLFNWANNEDRSGDTPVYLDKPAGIGKNMFL